MIAVQWWRRPVRAPTFLRIPFWSAKRLAILIGFALTALGSLGPQFYVSSVEDRSGETDQFAKALTARIDTLRAAQSQYLLFEQMGVLVYALNASGLAAPGSSQHDTLSSLYQLSLLDRSTSVRQMIGELARAKQLAYRETSDKYGALIAAARKDVSLASYQAVDDFETQTMRQADALMARLQDALLSAERTKGELDALAARRKLQLIMVMTLGSTLLLAANLMSEKPPPQEETPASSDEVAAAERLIELAMRESKAPDDAKAAETGEAPARPETKAPGLEGQSTAGAIAEASMAPPNPE
jgi:hypothetical protein